MIRVRLPYLAWLDADACGTQLAGKRLDRQIVWSHPVGPRSRSYAAPFSHEPFD
jgi:hypothetical protein